MERERARLTNLLLISVDCPGPGETCPGNYRATMPGEKLVLAALWSLQDQVRLSLRRLDSPVIPGPPGGAVDLSTLVLERVLRTPVGQLLIVQYLPEVSDPFAPPRMVVRVHADRTFSTLTDEELQEVILIDEKETDERPRWDFQEQLDAIQRAMAGPSR